MASVCPESDLLAVDAVGLEVEVVLVLLIRLTLVELSLSIVGELTMAVNREATIGSLVLITLEGVGRGYIMLVS